MDATDAMVHRAVPARPAAAAVAVTQWHFLSSNRPNTRG